MTNSNEKFQLHTIHMVDRHEMQKMTWELTDGAKFKRFMDKHLAPNDIDLDDQRLYTEGSDFLMMIDFDNEPKRVLKQISDACLMYDINPSDMGYSVVKDEIAFWPEDQDQVQTELEEQ